MKNRFEKQNENVNKAKAGESQEIQVKILKNRNGTKGDTVLDFFPKFNYFKEQANAQAGNYEGWKTIGG